MTSSVTGGYLLPDEQPNPLFDDPFEDFLQKVVVGVTGIDGRNIRPRWQTEPPNIPQANIDWIAFGIKSQKGDGTAVEHFLPGANVGADAMELQNHERVVAAISFFGPKAMSYAAIFRDGMQVAQNREVLFRNGIGLIDVTEPVAAPELIKNTWRKQYDVEWIMSRSIRRTYSVSRFASASGIIYNEHYETPFSVTDQ